MINVDLFADDDDGNTPLTAEEREALIPPYITLRRELNEVEQIGITEGEQWAFSRSRGVLNEGFLRTFIAECLVRSADGLANSASRPGASELTIG